MEIVTLIENTVCETSGGLEPEHGVSLLICLGKTKILFDMGISGRFLRNAHALGEKLEDVDLAVVSHGHFDHGGGLRDFMKINAKAAVYLKKGAFGEYYAKLFGGLISKYIGLDHSLLKTYPERFVLVNQELEPIPGVFLLPVFNRNHPLPLGNRSLREKRGGHFPRDDFNHELAMVLKTAAGLVLITGCSHNGLLNMLETVEARFPDQTVKTIIGGFHMAHPVLGTITDPHARVISIGRSLAGRFGLNKVYTGHCTGRRAFKILKRIMGEQLDVFSTGKRILL
ncbi:MBL fold metallo-hydrolase [bacterium]|nr:MBL fold metallo-hydrolase [bacterium]